VQWMTNGKSYVAYRMASLLTTLSDCEGVFAVCNLSNYHNYSRESEGIFLYRRWFVCLSVTMITKKIVDGFVPNIMGRFLGGK